MKANHPTSDRNDIRGTLGALMFIGVGAIAWWSMLGVGSASAVIFPHVVILLMTGFSALLVVRNLLGHAASEARAPRGSVPRRLGLLAGMFVAALAMPHIGFVTSALGAYLIIMAVAMYERWTPLRLAVYPLSGLAVVLLFYYLFDIVFKVPLPAGSLFG
ncbi:MAG: tripartite tricarboxylate transporter TctB family protein [Acidihalobacter sp.]|uniref:tripartite tricarboxylate transporter TctB family protein n=1 Tax=Acidihalobacter sp. TaxID=1872108 RepID=UPI00307EF005